MIRTKFVLFLFLFIIFSGLHPGQEKITINRGNRVALVIGNSTYTNLSPLPNTINDAEGMRDSLEKLNFRVTLKKDATHMDMGIAITEFCKNLKSSDVGLFYYAGHGVQSEGRNFFIPVGGDIQADDELSFKAVALNSLLEKLRTAGNFLNIVILDACRDDPFPESFRLFSQGSVVGLAETEPPPRTLIVYSAAPDSAAEKSRKRHQVFTGTLLEYIGKSGLEIVKMMEEVQFLVRLRTGEKQIPWKKSSLKSEFYFKKVQPFDENVFSKQLVLKEKEFEREKWMEAFRDRLLKQMRSDKNENIPPGKKQKKWEELLAYYEKEKPANKEDKNIKRLLEKRENFWADVKNNKLEVLAIPESQKPKLLKSVNARYPKIALKGGIEGKVVLNATTDIYGNVVKLEVLRGHPLLRDAARAAVQQWKYDLLIIDGVPKPVRFTVVITFSLASKIYSPRSNYLLKIKIAAEIYEKGENSFKNGNFKEAKKYFQECLKKSHNYCPAHYSLAVIFLREKNLPEALKYIKKAKKYSYILKTRKPPQRYHFFHAHVCYLMGDKKDSIKQLEKAIKTDPGFSRAYNSLVILHLENNQPNKAFIWLRKAEQNGVKIDPKLKADILKALKNE